MGAVRERVAGFGRLRDGLRQAGDWYLVLSTGRR
jgi:hypothetical protein